MSGNKLFIDSNIVLYLFSGDSTIVSLLDNKDLYVSFITELEVLGYPEITDDEKVQIEAFFSECQVININKAIKKDVIFLRRKYNMKLPDCIIAASAKNLRIPLITADKDFNKIDEINLLHYE